MNEATLSIYQLPNGQQINQLNEYETRYLVNEIFIDQAYLRHGVTLQSNSIVFDVGANIGIFSLYIKENFPQARIYAFEPSPAVYNILKHNLKPFGRKATAFALGLSDQEKIETFYYYPGYSVISGCYAEKERDTNTIICGEKASFTNKISPEDERLIESIVKKRMDRMIPLLCDMTTISHVISEQHIKRIDLLKIDVEGSEVSVLRGIKSMDWHKIKQIVVETHQENEKNFIVDLLREKNYLIHVDLDPHLGEAGISTIFAKRIES